MGAVIEVTPAADKMAKQRNATPTRDGAGQIGSAVVVALYGCVPIPPVRPP